MNKKLVEGVKRLERIEAARKKKLRLLSSFKKDIDNGAFEPSSQVDSTLSSEYGVGPRYGGIRQGIETARKRLQAEVDALTKSRDVAKAKVERSQGVRLAMGAARELEMANRGVRGWKDPQASRVRYGMERGIADHSNPKRRSDFINPRAMEQDPIRVGAYSTFIDNPIGKSAAINLAMARAKSGPLKGLARERLLSPRGEKFNYHNDMGKARKYWLNATKNYKKILEQKVNESIEDQLNAVDDAMRAAKRGENPNFTILYAKRPRGMKGKFSPDQKFLNRSTIDVSNTLRQTPDGPEYERYDYPSKASGYISPSRISTYTTAPENTIAVNTKHGMILPRPEPEIGSGTASELTDAEKILAHEVGHAWQYAALQRDNLDKAFQSGKLRKNYDFFDPKNRQSNFEKTTNFVDPVTSSDMKMFPAYPGDGKMGSYVIGRQKSFKPKYTRPNADGSNPVLPQDTEQLNKTRYYISPSEVNARGVAAAYAARKHMRTAVPFDFIKDTTKTVDQKQEILNNYRTRLMNDVLKPEREYIISRDSLIAYPGTKNDPNDPGREASAPGDRVLTRHARSVIRQEIRRSMSAMKKDVARGILQGEKDVKAALPKSPEEIKRQGRQYAIADRVHRQKKRREKEQQIALARRLSVEHERDILQDRQNLLARVPKGPAPRKKLLGIIPTRQRTAEE